MTSYKFEYERIESCYDCPMFDDRYECPLDLQRAWDDEDLECLGKRRPDWCRLEEETSFQKS